jgi:hypothetical protein
MDPAFDTDEFLQLLTDALRAGPGSPSWHQAITRLREGGVRAVAGADDYKLLLAARETLEQGKQYRSVRAGPAFTRELMARLDADGAGPKHDGPPRTTMWVAVVSLALLLGGAAAVAWMLSREAPPTTPGVEQLAAIYLGRTIAEAPLDAAPPLPWAQAGELKLDFGRQGARPATGDTRGGPLGAAIVLDQSIPADQPVAIEAKLRLRRNGADVVAQLFVTDTPAEFSQANATTPHELVLAIRDGTPELIRPDGSIQPLGARVADGKPFHTLRVRLSQTHAIVEIDNQRLWAGEHGLKPDGPRKLGVRFLCAAAPKQETAALGDVKVTGK